MEQQAGEPGPGVGFFILNFIFICLYPGFRAEGEAVPLKEAVFPCGIAAFGGFEREAAGERPDLLSERRIRLGEKSSKADKAFGLLIQVLNSNSSGGSPGLF